MDVLLFTKCLSTVGDLSRSAAAERIADLGFDGADLTVREGGYVDPETVGEELPRAIETFAEHDVCVPMITTRLTGASERAERVFAAADACDVAYLKLGYWPYDGLGTLDDGLDAMTADLAGIDDLASEHDVTPAVHVHSGEMLSADGTLLAAVLSEFDNVAAYPDGGHLAVEGADSGWQIALERLASQAAVMGVKDYAWTSHGDARAKEPVVLGEGLVDWESALDFLAEADFDGPLSLHAEYNTDFEDLLRRIRADLDHVRGVLA